MAKIETFRKRAKLLMRWHSERNYSLGERVRTLSRFSHLTDVQVLDMPFPLSSAQEIVAVEAGFADWPALRGAVNGEVSETAPYAALRLARAIPVLFVRNVAKAAAFYERELGFRTDFLHGNPPFYGSVSRDGARLHLRFVREPNFAALSEQEDSLTTAFVEVSDVKALYREFESRGVEFAQRLVNQAWGGLDFQIFDLDQNKICFAQYR